MAVPHTGSEAWTAAMHKLKDAPECADVNSSSDVELLKKCDGVVSPWQAWHNSEAPPQVSAAVRNNQHHKRRADLPRLCAVLDVRVANTGSVWCRWLATLSSTARASYTQQSREQVSSACTAQQLLPQHSMLKQGPCH